MSGQATGDLARRLIRDHVLQPGDVLLGSQLRSQAVLVSTSRWDWLVEPRRRPPTSVDALRIFNVSMDVMEDPPSPGRGFAIGAGSPDLDLGVPADLVTLWGRAAGRLPLRDVAELLVDYQAGEQVAGIIRSPEDLGSVVAPETIRGLAGYVDPILAHDALGDHFSFCTYVIDVDDAGREGMVVDLWDVTASGAGIHWERRVLGRIPDPPGTIAAATDRS